MFTLPKLRHAQPWHEQLKVRQWVNQFFALGSRKRNYHVTIGRNPHGHLAWVHAEARRVYVSSSLLPVPPDHIRFDPVDEHRRTELLLKALLAHEAGHVRFSGPNPGGKLGELWNSLEDERIERLMVREFHELGPAFTFIGDIAAETGRQAGAWSYTAMEGTLIWRFEHDRFHAHWAPRAEDHDIWHSTVRPLVESAWTLGTSEEVLAVAGEILEVLRQHQHSLTPPPAPEPEEQTPPPEQDPAATEPEDEQEPGEQEEEPETDSGEGQGQSSDDSADGEGPPESGEAEPGGGQDDSGEGGEQPDGGAGQPDTHTDGSTEDATDGEGQSGSGAGEPGGGEAQSGEDDSAAEGEQPDGGEAEADGDQGDSSEGKPGNDQDDSGEGGGPSGGGVEQPDTNPDGSSAEGSSSDESRPPDSGEGQSTDGQAGADGGESSDAKGPSSGNDQGGTDHSGQPGRIPSPTSNVSPEQQAAENADDHCSPDAWGQVSASGADADERDGDAEQRCAQEQEDGEASGEQREQASPGQPQASGDGSGDPEPQDAPGQGQGRRASTQDTELPPMPQPDHGGGMVIAQDVEGHARRLAPLLKPPERPGRTRPHRSKGRYDARRDARDAERVFVRKTVASRPLPIRVRLLIDISISMGGEPIRCARAAAGMVVRAAALSGSSAEVHLFNTRHQAVITGPMPYLTAQALIAGIEVGGYTCLSPALAVLSDSPAHPLEKELIVIVCDGQLDETDYQQCAQIVKRGKAAGKEYLPVLISEAASDHQEWREIFGSALPCESVTDLGLNIKAALTNLRSRLGS